MVLTKFNNPVNGYTEGMPLLERTRIILVAPSLPENVGAVARSMAHFGLRTLVLAEGGVDPLHPQAIAVSAGNERILQEARRAPSLEEALAGTVLAIGTTARPYDSPGMRSVDPKEAAALSLSAQGPVALVFGTEKHGLTKAALQRCHQVARIPGEASACLNLAMAASIFFYEWRQAARLPDDLPSAVSTLANDGLLESLEGRLSIAMKQLGLFKPHDEPSKRHTLRRVLSRARLDPDEAQLLLATAYRLNELLARHALEEPEDSDHRNEP